MNAEPIVDFQDGAMSGPNRAVDHCTVEVIEDATFTELTFRSNYDHTRVPFGIVGDLGAVATDAVTTGVVFSATTCIRGVKSYQLATGSIIAYHYKN